MATLIEKDARPKPNSQDCAALSVADAVWVGTALLHRKYSQRAQFSIEEIVESVVSHHLTNGALVSIRQHVTQHCVANRKAMPNRSRMLFATRDDPGETHRRIFRDCDHIRTHPSRLGAPFHPAWEKLPKQYADLQGWYEEERKKGSEPKDDPLLALIGTGKGLFDGLSADEYVSSLRQGWEGRQ